MTHREAAEKVLRQKGVSVIRNCKVLMNNVDILCKAFVFSVHNLHEWYLFEERS